MKSLMWGLPQSCSNGRRAASWKSRALRREYAQITMPMKSTKQTTVAATRKVVMSIMVSLLRCLLERQAQGLQVGHGGLHLGLARDLFPGLGDLRVGVGHAGDA